MFNSGLVTGVTETSKLAAQGFDPASAADIPSYRRPELVQAEPDIALVNDLLAGTRVMHDKSHIYIRRWSSESQAVYDIRRKIEKVFEGLSRTLSASIGMLYAKQPQVNWNQSETAISEDWNNIDTMGTAGPVFVKKFTEWAIRDGLAGLLIDHTPPPAGVVVTAGNEGSLNLRPVWAAYNRASILSWRHEKINNQLTLTQVVLREQAEVPNKRFGVTIKTRYRELRLVPGLSGEPLAMWTLFEATKDSAFRPENFAIIGQGVFRNKNGLSRSSLPFRIAYCGRSDAPLTAQIPLLGVGWANLSHWQQSTNLRFYRELCAFPQPTVIGDLAQEAGAGGVMVPGKIKIGPMVAVHITTGGDFKFTELTGSSMAELQKGIEQEEWHMSQLGMSFLVKNSRQQETAEAKRMDATAENSTLSTAAQGVQDCVNGGFEDHAWYYGIEKAAAPVMEINKDFDAIAIDAPTMAVYVAAVKDAGLPPRLLLEAWQQGGRLPPDEDLDALEVEMMANQAAAAATATANAQLGGGPGAA